MKRDELNFDDARFLKFIKVDRDTHCWEWLGRVDSHGYGTFHIGKRRLAHRVSLLIFNGEVDDNLFADHTCRNRKCVNPDHLREVTQAINTLENSIGIAAVNSFKTECPKGHPLSGDNLRINSGKRTCKECRKIIDHNYHQRNRDKNNENRRNKRKLSRDSGKVE